MRLKQNWSFRKVQRQSLGPVFRILGPVDCRVESGRFWLARKSERETERTARVGDESDQVS